LPGRVEIIEPQNSKTSWRVYIRTRANFMKFNRPSRFEDFGGELKRGWQTV